MSSGTVQMWILAFSAWVLWGVLGFYVAGQRGIGLRSGYLIGLLLRLPFGVTILALIPVRASTVVDLGPHVWDAQCEPASSRPPTSRQPAIAPRCRARRFTTRDGEGEGVVVSAGLAAESDVHFFNCCRLRIGPHIVCGRAPAWCSVSQPRRTGQRTRRPPESTPTPTRWATTTATVASMRTNQVGIA